MRLLAILALVLLSACAPIATDGIVSLNFQPGPVDAAEIDPRDLLREQRVPTNRLLSISEAIKRAPDGSPILTCHRHARFANFWGPCSHIARKLSGSRIAETVSPLPGENRVGIYPAKRLEKYYAVLVLDAGQNPDDLAAFEAETARLAGSPYALNGEPGTYYCSTFQNRLEEAAGRPALVPEHSVLGVALPADVLLQPHVKVLYVGLNPKAR
jgi:hypothetical protein